jgi:hypothetical protein
MNRHGVGWLIILTLAIVGYTVAVVKVGHNASHSAEVAAQKAADDVTQRITGTIIASQKSNCYASTKRTVLQLHYDYVVYQADVARSKNPDSSPSQRKIANVESHGQLLAMKGIASEHVDVSAAGKIKGLPELPPVLAHAVSSTGYQCSTESQPPSIAR